MSQDSTYGVNTDQLAKAGVHLTDIAQLAHKCLKTVEFIDGISDEAFGPRGNSDPIGSMGRKESDTGLQYAGQVFTGIVDVMAGNGSNVVTASQQASNTDDTATNVAGGGRRG